MARAQQHAAVTRDQRKDMSRPRKITGAGIWVGKRAAAGGAFFRRNSGAAIGLIVDRHRKRGGVARFVMRDHRVEPQSSRVLARDRRADDARGVADDERHLLGRAERSRDDQVALALAIIVVGHDDELAAGKGLQYFLDRIGHYLKVSRSGAGRISRTPMPAPASLRRAARLWCRSAADNRIRTSVQDLSRIEPNQKQGSDAAHDLRTVRLRSTLASGAARARGEMYGPCELTF